MIKRFLATGLFDYHFKPSWELLRSAVIVAFVAGSRVAFTGDPNTLESWKTYAVAVGGAIGTALFFLVLGKQPEATHAP